MTFLFVLAAIVMLGIMVTVHEAGHFWAARLTSIPVKEFAIGFGPKILSWKSKKHETQFFLRLIPAGGYCMFYGEDDIAEKEKDDPRSMNNFPVWRRIVTVFAGPVMNFVLALIVASSIFLVQGEAKYTCYTVVESVTQGSPAELAGFQPQDVITAVNGEDAAGMDETGKTYKLSALIGRYREGDAPLTLTVRRGEETLTLSAAPRFDESEGRFLLGVGLLPESAPEITPVSLPRAIHLGADYCVDAGGAILRSLRDLVTTGKGLKESSGPVGIIKGVAETTQAAAEQSAGSALSVYAQLLVLISVNLGLFNLLPIPGLDGSRILFLLIEGIRRKPINRKIEAYVYTAGTVLLLGLMLVLTFKDVWTIFKGPGA